MKVLITGGAGFIGSTIASAAIDAGFTPVILDSLVTGRREFTAGRALLNFNSTCWKLISSMYGNRAA